MRPHAGWAVRSPVRHLVLTMLFFLFAGPMIAGPVAVSIIWYWSLPDMGIGRAVGSGFVVTLLGFWAIIAVGALPALAVGFTVSWVEATRGDAGLFLVMAAGLVSGIGWGLVLQHTISEFVAVVPGVAAGSVVASAACWGFVRWARARRARRPS